MLDPEPTLYLRLGGYDAIAAFVDDLLVRLFSDPRLGAYWKGKSQDSLRKDRQLLVDFLAMITGGPVHYLGRDMRTSHAGLGIDGADWDAFAAHAVATLQDLSVAEREAREVMALAAGLRADICAVV
jgi:hemoglobin